MAEPPEEVEASAPAPAPNFERSVSLDAALESDSFSQPSATSASRRQQPPSFAVTVLPSPEKLASDLAQGSHNKTPARRWSIEKKKAADGTSSVVGGGPISARSQSQQDVEMDGDEEGVATFLDGETEVSLINDVVKIDSSTDPVLKVLVKTPAERTDDDLNMLLKTLLHSVKFFRQLNDQQQRLELCRYMRYEKLDRNELIFQQGSVGSTFYIIYSGAVKVLVADNRFKYSPGDMGNCVAVLEDGDSFGELALLGNGHRAASTLTAMETHILKVEKDNYDKSLLRVHAFEHAERVNFLQRIFLFSDWEDEMLTRLAQVVIRRKYGKNETIIQQGSMTNHMYFLVKGRCRVLKRMGLTAEQRDKLSATRGGHGVERLIKGSHDEQSLDPSSMPGSPRVPGVFAGYAPLQLQPPPTMAPDGTTFLELNMINAHQFFGERALMDGVHKGVHSASVVTTAPSECLLLSKHDFYHFIDAKTQELLVAYGEKFYYDEERIRRSIAKQHKWVEYKKDLLKEVTTPRSARG